MKDRLIHKAIEMGFADIKIVSAEPILKINYPHETDPQKLFPGTRSIVVLFWRYGPGICEKKEDEMALSSYYICSNKAYHSAKDLAEWMNENGLPALYTSKMSARSLALRSGGFAGKNAQFVHPKLGTFVIIETILCAVELETDKRDDTAVNKICAHCRLCEEVCPTEAIRSQDFQKDCLRANISNNPIPLQMRGKVEQLLGCEKCQEVCPYNAGVLPLDVPVYFVTDILSGEAIREIQDIAGKNMARTNILLAQTLAYAKTHNIAVPERIMESLREKELLLEMTEWMSSEED